MRKSLNFSNKKGNVPLEMYILLIFVFGLALSFPILYSHIEPIFTSFAGSTAFGTEATETIDKFNDRLPTMMDNMFLIGFILLWIGAITLALFIDTHPIFFLFSLILVGAMLFSAIFLGNFADNFINQETLSLAKANMPIIAFVSGHILEFMIAVAFTILVSLYGKNRAGAS